MSIGLLDAALLEVPASEDCQVPLQVCPVRVLQVFAGGGEVPDVVDSRLWVADAPELAV
ncbi:MAG: hypothetical protein WC343_13625 [Bacilli bacterium]|jgi:hypothetical protein